MPVNNPVVPAVNTEGGQGTGGFFCAITVPVEIQPGVDIPDQAIGTCCAFEYQAEQLSAAFVLKDGLGVVSGLNNYKSLRLWRLLYIIP